MLHKAVLLVGLPGTGKGTHGAAIGKMPGFRHFSMGDMLRSQPPDSRLGKAVKDFADRGELVSDELVVDLLADALGRDLPAGHVALLDGVPRTTRQAEMLRGTIDVLAVINFVVLEEDEGMLVERLKRRAASQGRKDDADESIIRRRMEVYLEQTLPVIHCYPDHCYWQVTATGRPDRDPLSVLQEVAAILMNVTTINWRPERHHDDWGTA